MGVRTGIAPGRPGTAVLPVDQMLELGAVCQPDPAHHVHLPEFHGAGAFPAAEVGPLAPARFRSDEAVAKEAAVDGGASGERFEACLFSSCPSVVGPHSGFSTLSVMIRASTSGGIW